MTPGLPFYDITSPVFEKTTINRQNGKTFSVVAEGASLSPVAPFRVLNIGNSQPEPLMDFISALEEATGVEAKKNMMEMQAGDVVATWANSGLLESIIGYKPETPRFFAIAYAGSGVRPHMATTSTPATLCAG